MPFGPKDFARIVIEVEREALKTAPNFMAQLMCLRSIKRAEMMLRGR